MGEKPYKRIGPVYDGFYIHKYDMDGNLIWKMAHTDAEELLDEKHFRVHARPFEREVNLIVLPDGTLNFSVYCWTNLFTYEIGPNGQLKKV